MKVLQGDCVTVLKEQVEKESIDTIYTCPSPFRYYEDEITGKLGSEVRMDEYFTNLMRILDACYDVLKDSGSLFLQVPENFNMNGGVLGMPVMIENKIRNRGTWFFANRLFWHRKETLKLDYKEKGFLKNYEYIFHLIKDYDKFYFNVNSKYARTSVFSYPIEDSYFTNEFDSGLPEQLFRMVIDTTVPPNGTILDPLAGTGKVGVVAKKMNRDAILIDIDFETCERIKTRLGLQ